MLTLSINCYSQSNRQRLEDIQDQLDMMEYEKAIKDIQVDQENALRNVQRNKEYSNYRSLIKRTDKIVKKNKDQLVAIKVDSINVIKDGFMTFTVISEFTKPQYLEKEVYFGNAVVYFANCKKREMAIMGGTFYGKNLDVISEGQFPILFKKIPTSGPSNAVRFMDYICP